MWWKPLTEIPTSSGWVLCDGQTYGTETVPDLRDRFIYGVNTGEDPGTTGGNSNPHTHSYSAVPVHNHTVNNGSHSHSVNIRGGAAGARYGGPDYRDIHARGSMQSTGTSSSPTNVSINPAGTPGATNTDPESHLPNFIRMAFICKL